MALQEDCAFAFPVSSALGASPLARGLARLWEVKNPANPGQTPEPAPSGPVPGDYEECFWV